MLEKCVWTRSEGEEEEGEEGEEKRGGGKCPEQRWTRFSVRDGR